MSDATPDFDLPDFDLSDDDLRAAGSAKWTYPPTDVLPAWVAEMDVRPCPAVVDALAEAVRAGRFGYPTKDSLSGLPEATAGFLADRFGWQVDPADVRATGDVMAGVLLSLTTVCDDAPVVVPVPSYPPFLDVVPLSGRALVPVPFATATRADGTLGHELDLDAVGAALGAGARTVLLAAPHNPLGRAFTPAELAALRDVVDHHGARVVSDEIHAPLVLAGAVHTPYASVEGAAEHSVTLVAASKAWNLPGLKCAQLVTTNRRDRERLADLPIVANHGTSTLGVVATVAAYRHGVPWLDGLLTHLADMRAEFGRLLAERLPAASWTPMEATYLAWLDARGTGHADPARRALERGRVMVNPGAHFGPGYDGFVRVNLATSAERLGRVVDALASAWA